MKILLEKALQMGRVCQAVRSPEQGLTGHIRSHMTESRLLLPASSLEVICLPGSVKGSHMIQKVLKAVT